MKDLKHYFTSPAGSDNEVLNGNNEIISRKRKIKSESNSLECSSTTLVGTKKKKKRKNHKEESVQDKSPEIDLPKSQKKRKRTIEKASSKKTRITKLLENVNIPQKTGDYNEKIVKNELKKLVDSSKENSMNTSLECDEKSFDISNNLHNYFGKIDKPLDIHLKSNILKVEAIVHYPPSEEKTKPPKILKTRLRRRKSLDLRPEYDIITSEEDNSSVQNSLNELSADVAVTLERDSTADEIVTSPESLAETSGNTDKIIAKYQNNLGKYSTPVAGRVKHDGTLNSFFKINNRMEENPLHEVNKDRIRAKQQCLNSGIPDNIRKVTYKQKDVLIEGAPFPKQQHVTQADTLSVMWNLKIIKLKLKISQPHLINIPPWSHIVMLKSETESLGIEGAELNSLDRKQIIKALRKEIPDYPIKKWYTELFKMKADCENEMWTEKYKPKSSLHLIGNSKNVDKLKSWLQKLKSKIKKENVTYCSEDEFLIPEDESVTGIKNTAIIQGPAGIGKTASIYALAEEIGYQILEINTSCNRMGKKILNEFSEALQSHKVEGNVLNFIGTRKNIVDNSKKKSLFLIEDIDVTFLDYDEGFLSTIATLAATSKRPIICTVNNFNPEYLAKIIPFMQFKLDFEPLHQNWLSSWVRTLAAVEGIVLDKPKADKLIEWANGDIRKLLLQLQFSLTKVNYSEHEIQTNNVWERMSQNRFDSREQAKNTAHLCNLLVVCDLLNGVLNCQLSSDDPAKKPWRSTLKYSSEVSQPNESTDHPSREMLADTIQILKEKSPFRHQYHTIRSEKSMAIPSIEREVLSFSSLLSHSSVATDYVPALRTIARYENKRLAGHTKRNNRYFSYLQSIGITENTMEISNVLSETLS